MHRISFAREPELYRLTRDLQNIVLRFYRQGPDVGPLVDPLTEIARAIVVSCERQPEIAKLFFEPIKICLSALDRGRYVEAVNAIFLCRAVHKLHEATRIPLATDKRVKAALLVGDSCYNFGPSGVVVNRAPDLGRDTPRLITYAVRKFLRRHFRAIGLHVIADNDNPRHQ